MKFSIFKGFSFVFSLLLFACAVSALPQHVLDFDGDARTDFVVVRNTGGGSGGQVTWFTLTNGPGVFSGTQWGISTDYFVSGDFDGDMRSDLAVYREGSQSYFYILRSSNGTLFSTPFGTAGDDPTVVGDYDGDGKTDPAVYRAGASAGQQSFWYYRSSINGTQGSLPWGQNGDFPAPGDYDGDHMADVAVQRGINGAGIFFIRNSGGGFTTEAFGLPSDSVVPGDYDGDGRTDVAVARTSGGNWFWYYDPSSVGGVQAVGGPFGASATDFLCQGDYDGDGRTDFAVWRATGTFYANRSTGGLLAAAFGQSGDYPVGNFNTH